ncbi:MAG: HlyC/CorC family transporter [Phycisphaerales bacterium]|nr:HlyC/CorC family transporter [Phycisphaerales bacterium]
MTELRPMELALLVALPPLLLASAFFSGSETALFGLRANEQATIRLRGGLAARAVAALLGDPRQLLLTVLLGNMTVNTLYFVISSVLLMSPGRGLAWNLGVGVGTLVAVVLFGEVLPKLVFNADRVRSASVVAAPLLGLHRLLSPLRQVLDTIIVAPLSRLTAPAQSPPRLSGEELDALLEVSSRLGHIDADEQRLLEQVVQLRGLRVREVMTPRVKMHAVPASARRIDIVEVMREARLTTLPVYRGGLDEVVGMLQAKAYLLDPRAARTPLVEHMLPPLFVPEVATLEQLLALFRRERRSLAIVVDEYGGTAGIIATEDVLEQLVGEIRSPEEHEVVPPRLLGVGRWAVSGDMAIRDWAEAFETAGELPPVATVGGLVLVRLGRVPEVGDEVTVGELRLIVRAMDGHRVSEVEVALQIAPRPERPVEQPVEQHVESRHRNGREGRR